MTAGSCVNFVRRLIVQYRSAITRLRCAKISSEQAQTLRDALDEKTRFLMELHALLPELLVVQSDLRKLIDERRFTGERRIFLAESLPNGKRTS